jgi:hypothetical protein
MILESLLEYLKLYFSIIFIFILPGYSLLYLFFPKKFLNLLEKIVLSLALSITEINFLIIILDKFKIVLNFSNLFSVTALLIAIPLVLSTFPWFKKLAKKTEKRLKSKDKTKFGRKFNLIFYFLIALTFILSARFIASDIVPNNTDLGHHMYWVKLMARDEKIPDYESSDVIIGEHLPFLILNKISGVEILSSLPTIFLFFLTIFSMFAVFILTERIFKNNYLSLIVYLLIGVFYVIASPFMKFVTGGVVGNLMGNLLIPLVLYSIFLAYKFKERKFLGLALFLYIGLFYIHHLSTFLLTFVILTFGLIHLLTPFFRFNNKSFKTKFKKFKSIFFNWLKMLLRPLPLAVLIFFGVIIFFVYTPHYVANDAYETVVKTPDKDSHQGVSISSFVSSIGEWRTILGLLGLLLLTLIFLLKNKLIKRLKSFKKLSLNFKINALNFAILFSWILILLILSFYPGLLKVDLPSRRVVNYLIAPLSITGALFLIFIFNLYKQSLKNKIFVVLLFTLGLSLSLNGISESIKYFRSDDQFEETVQLYHATRYLAQKTDQSETILKDHANMTADTWIKYFFLRGYDYVISRTFDYKYEDNPDRDPCPFIMATAPDSKEGKACFEENSVDYVILKKNIDNFFFDLSDNFGKIYENETVVIYRRTPQQIFQ